MVAVNRTTARPRTSCWQAFKWGWTGKGTKPDVAKGTKTRPARTPASTVSYRREPRASGTSSSTTIPITCSSERDGPSGREAAQHGAVPRAGVALPRRMQRDDAFTDDDLRHDGASCSTRSAVSVSSRARRSVRSITRRRSFQHRCRRPAIASAWSRTKGMALYSQSLTTCISGGPRHAQPLRHPRHALARSNERAFDVWPPARADRRRAQLIDVKGFE